MISFRATLTLLLGIAVGGLIASFSLAGPARSVYVVTEVESTTDDGSYDGLKKTMTGVIEAQFQDGRYLARTENITALDGAAPKAIIIISFDSEAKARAYHDNTSDTSAVHTKASKSRSFMVSLCTEGGKLLPDC
jgi:uncharacterized protein (DUF1330 family)